VTIEHARASALPKPWGIFDLRPWSNARHEGGAIGEIWYERSGRKAAESSLLLKILFTNQPLSIQVHPDDAFAHSARRSARLTIVPCPMPSIAACGSSTKLFNPSDSQDSAALA
jgi:phosphomannose isomerase type I-like protein